MELPPGATIQFQTGSDKKKLIAKHQDGSAGCAIAGGMLAVILPPIAGFMASPKAGFFTSLIFVPIGIYLIYAANKSETGLALDIKEGKKVVLRSTLTNKTEQHGKRAAYYYLHIGERTFSTDISTYVRSEIGQLIEIHYGPHSGTTLTVDLKSEEKENS
jgi:hypothetical protein